MNLSEFLLERIAEDRQIAAAAAQSEYDDQPQWTEREAYATGYDAEIIDGEQSVIASVWGGGEARHIAHHDPARVLAECEAKRRIVQLHTAAETPTICPVCCYDGQYQGEMLNELAPCPTLRLLALPYADHPDYDETWRP